jgi:ribosome-binding protein aMBF1 (putative translation factor)
VLPGLGVAATYRGDTAVGEPMRRRKKPTTNIAKEKRKKTGRLIRRARLRRQWTQASLVLQIRLVAHAKGLVLPADRSLTAMLSRWERGHKVPSELYRRLLCQALGIRVTDIGLTEDPDYVWTRAD